MKVGERRGEVPIEEIEWLRAHVVCESVAQLFRDYSEEFDYPYTNLTSFRRILDKHSIFPISKYNNLELVTRMLSISAKGPVHWTFQSKSFREGMEQPPHWLWRWHGFSIKTASGVIFRDYPVKLKEIQFEEEVVSRDSYQGSFSERVYRSLSDELSQSEQDEARCAEPGGDLHQPSSEDAEAGMDRLPLDGEEQP